MSILYSTEAVFVASHSDRVDQDTVQGFYFLAILLLNRLQLFNQPSDAQQCIEYFRYLESQPLGVFGVSLDEVNVYLLMALASQVELGIGNAARNIDEMMARFRDLLAANIPQPLLKLTIKVLFGAMNEYSLHSRASEYLEILIDHLREADRRLGSYDPFVAEQLALHLCRRFREMYSIDDYKEAMALFDKIITSEPNIDCPGRHASTALFFSASLAAERAAIYKKPEYLEEAIYCHRRCLRAPFPNDFGRSLTTQELASLIKRRSSHFGITAEGLLEACSPDPGVTSFRHLVASLRARYTIGKTDWWVVPEERAKHIRALETVCHYRCSGDRSGYRVLSISPCRSSPN